MNGHSNFNRVHVWISFVEASYLTLDEIMDLEETGELEEDDEDDFGAFGPNSVSPLKAKYRRVTIKINSDATSNITIVSKAFTWTYPWIRCHLSVFKGKSDISFSLKRGFFEVLAYELLDSPGHSSLQDFMSNVSPPVKSAFEEHIRESPDVRLSRFWDLAEGWKDVRSVELLETMKSSPEGATLLLSQEKPLMFKYGSLLFRNKFLSLLEKSQSSPSSDNESDLLEDLEIIASRTFWALGFNDVLYKKMSVSGLEVRLKSLKATPFYMKLETLHQNALELYDGIKNKCYREGHTYMTRCNVESLIPGCLDLDGILSFLKKQGVISIIKDPSPAVYQLTRFKTAEEKIVSTLKSLLWEEPAWTIELEEEDDSSRGLVPDKEQARASAMIAQNAITVISGRGGTGKTEIVTRVLSGLKPEVPLEGGESKEECSIVLYVAPTGKAASVIRTRIQCKAYTIHQIISSHKKFLTEPSNTWKYACVKVLVVDECSMVGITIFSHLLSILYKDSQLKKIVLLGDVLQLPSIDPGNLMSDLFESLRPHKFSIELLTNHRSEGTLLFDNASRISKGEMPLLNEAQGFTLIKPISNDAALSPVALNLKKQFSSLIKNEDTFRVNAYLKLLLQNAKEFELDLVNASQIISFTRKECELLNQLCCQIYNNHHIYSYYGGRKTKSFLEKDKIMCTRNKDVPLLIIEKDVIIKKTEERLMNGSVYLIDSIKSYAQCIKKEEEENENGEEKSSLSGDGGSIGRGLVLTYELNDLMGERIYVEKKTFDKLSRPCHSWALTIHKFQGSETNTIVYGMSGTRNENWQHVYTAVTRGKKKVIIVGSYSDLKAAVSRSPRPRQTRFKLLMEDLLLNASLFPSDNELESFSDEVLNNSLWTNNASFDVMLSQLEEAEVINEDTPPSSPSKRPRTATNITPSLEAKLRLF